MSTARVALAIAMLAACRDEPRPKDQLAVSPERPPVSPGTPSPFDAAPARMTVSCEVFAGEVATALAALLKELGREAPPERFAAHAKGIEAACHIATDTAWASSDRKRSVAACLADGTPALERVARCFPGEISFSELDRTLVHGPSTGETFDQQAPRARAQGSWKSTRGATLRIQGREVDWMPSTEPRRADTIVDRGEVTELLIFERHTHELAVGRNGRRILVLTAGDAQEEPAGPGPRLHDLDSGYGLVLDASGGCRAITPKGKVIEATCDRSSDSLEVTADKRTWQMIVFDNVLAPAAAVEGVYSRAH